MHRHRYRFHLALCVVLAAPLAACDSSDDDEPDAPAALSPKSLREQASALFGALVVPPAPAGADRARIELGRRLFFEPLVSADGTVSCATCHTLENWGSDGLAKSVGFMNRENARNAPTVINAAGQLAQHWRGDRTSLEDQAERSVTGMASFGNETPEAVMDRLRDADYEPDFKAAFPDDTAPLVIKRFAEAVGAYERTLIAPSRFDDFLSGNDAALTRDELQGLSDFVDTGCAGCHGGPLLGGQSLKKFGVTRDYPELTHSAKPDAGRFDVTQQEADRNVFKVPVLRNVEHTGPYFHDGSVAELDSAVRVMGEAQLGRQLADGAVASIVTFLRTLSAPVPAQFAPPMAP